ncbi:CvpA family protein [Lentilactobacillus raoultii]|uniref:CvpA family protein n=1 Tax=Lentilactobacillus raoultii TaxID=1987503 RepID=A0ABW3PRJ5_9LACO|nr:CvpA family protein [Lentilactobacillus raoultii]
MVLNLIIMAILAIGFWTGWRRGFVNELLSLVGLVISVSAGFLLTDPVMTFISYWFSHSDKNHPLFKVIIFIIVFSLAWQVIRVLRQLFNPITKLPVISQINSLLGSGISLVIRYLLVFILLNFLILVPSQEIQQQYNQSVISQWIIKQTPILSEKLANFWTTNSNGENL